MAHKIPFDEQEYAEIARRQYQEHEYSQNNPDEAEDEATRIEWRRKLKAALSILTPRQREVYILIVGYRQTEKKIAAKLKISQQAVCDRYRRAEKKLRQFGQA